MDKFYIAITGRRNTGKSSLTNLILGQEKAVVSSVPGTTTDPVRKSYEIPGVATLVLVDTAGTDDTGILGELRVSKTFDAIREADAAILVIAGNTFGTYEEELINLFNKLKQPFFIVHNKSDRTPLSPFLRQQLEKKYGAEVLDMSVLSRDTTSLMAAISRMLSPAQQDSLTAGLVKSGQVVMLVTPIDSEAPTGRMILPQVQTLRSILDRHCTCIVLQPGEIRPFISKTSFLPDLVITDSQVFGQVAAIIPEHIPLTSFSILMAHHKGNFGHYLQGTVQIDKLRDGDRILMLESCSHHVSCEDIGRKKIPALIRKHTGKQLEFDFITGLDRISRPFTDYALIIQCGGCMVTRRQLTNRLQPAIEAGIPVSNYGMVISRATGIFERATLPFRQK